MIGFDPGFCKPAPPPVALCLAPLESESCLSIVGGPAEANLPGTCNRPCLATRNVVLCRTVPTQAAALAIFSLPEVATEGIFQSLGLKGQEALSMTCKAFRACFHLSSQRRYQSLLASDREGQLFTRFGMNCPEGEAPSHAQMKAMVARLETILFSLRQGLKDFPEAVVPDYTAEALSLQLPPTCLQEVLKLAYHCNLYKIFAPLATLPASLSLEEAIKCIQAWLVAPIRRRRWWS